MTDRPTDKNKMKKEDSCKKVCHLQIKLILSRPLSELQKIWNHYNILWYSLILSAVLKGNVSPDWISQKKCTISKKGFNFSIICPVFERTQSFFLLRAKKVFITIIN